jgi:hypothetical protein
MIEHETSSSSVFNRIRDNRKLRMMVGIGALSLIAGCGSSSDTEPSRPSASVMQTQESIPTPTDTAPTAIEVVTASGIDAVTKINAITTSGTEKLVGESTANILAYLNSNTDIMNGREQDYYLLAPLYDASKTGLENGLKDAVAEELAIYIDGSESQIQDLLTRKQLSVQDLAYLYDTYTTLYPKFVAIEKEAISQSANEEFVLREEPILHGVVVKSGAALLAISRIAELYNEGKLTLADSESCDYDPSYDFVNSDHDLQEGDGFIVINEQQPPTERPFFADDRFNPFYSGLTTVGTFGILSTERSQECSNNIPMSTKKMLFPYYANARAAAFSLEDGISVNPGLAKLKYKALITLLKLDIDEALILNTYKEV